MKKIIALSLSILFVLLSFTSCGKASDNPSTPSSPTASGQENVKLVAADLAFEKYEKGLLDYTTLSEFTVKSDDAYQCMSE